MGFQVPRRFTPEWWLWLASGGFTFGFLTYLVLFSLGVFTNPLILIGVALVGSVVGDLLMAASFEVIAPTKITLGPGERVRKDQAVKELATIESGFRNSAIGTVRVRGEFWSARNASGADVSLDAGDKVQVLDREGLVLLIQPEP